MKRRVVRFVGHYVEMVVAMFVGMGLLALLWMLIWPGLGDHPVLDTLVMAVNMTIGMAAWMAIRGHDRRLIVEMSVAMVAPFVALLAPLAAGAITASTLMTAGHSLMFLTMFGAMLVRREAYAHDHGTARMRNRRTRRFGKIATPGHPRIHRRRWPTTAPVSGGPR